MNVELINYSQVPWENVMGVQVNAQTNLLDQIAYCARVSNPSNQNTDAPSDKLVRYLIKNQHCLRLKW